MAQVWSALTLGLQSSPRSLLLSLSEAGRAGARCNAVAVNRWVASLGPRLTSGGRHSSRQREVL